MPCELATHKVSQHERRPPHGSFCSAHEPGLRQRPTLLSHEWLQQSSSAWQRSPSARQKFMNAHLPVDWPVAISQKPEQQLLLLVQASPSVVQPVPCVVHLVPTQLLSQQLAFVAQVPLACTQLPPVAHTPPEQKSLQQSAARVHAWPGALHSLASMQRMTPPGSCSHRPEQQPGELAGAHTSPTGRHDVAATSHLPLTQLSLQQSVFCAQVWWKPLHVAQLTPTRQVLPEQQPLAQLVVSQMQVALVPEPEQRVPDGHGPPVEPQTHASLVVSQRFVDDVAQVTQAVPGEPHDVSLSVVQVAPVQQPVEHNVELQPEQTPSGFGD
jgi:hypothetical protein